MTTAITDTVISTVTESEKAKTAVEREWILRGLEYSAWLKTFSHEEGEK